MKLLNLKKFKPAGISDKNTNNWLYDEIWR